jgi:peptide/nickel transport system substrate-binding protein
MTGLTDAHIDEVLEEARMSVDQNKRNELYKEVYKWIGEECGTIPVFAKKYYVAFNKNIQGVYAHSVGFCYPRYISWAK